MSAANDLLKKIIGKLNAAVKTEAMALAEEEKTIARINIGAQAAITGAPGQLLYIAADGSVTPLTLGNGLAIVDGVLNVITGTVSEGYAALVDSGGFALLDAEGNTFVVKEE